MSDVTFFQNVLLYESVSLMRLFKKPNDLWCLRTESNRHGDMPQGILSLLKLVTYASLSQYILGVIFIIIFYSDI